MIDIQALITNLEQMSCAEHNQHPQINLTGEDLSIAACCQPFHDQVAAQLQLDIEAAMTKVMEEAMKHLQ
jgi:hypothetical protein